MGFKTEQFWNIKRTGKKSFNEVNSLNEVRTFLEQLGKNIKPKHL